MQSVASFFNENWLGKSEVNQIASEPKPQRRERHSAAAATKSNCHNRTQRPQRDGQIKPQRREGTQRKSEGLTEKFGTEILGRPREKNGGKNTKTGKWGGLGGRKLLASREDFF